MFDAEHTAIFAQHSKLSSIVGCDADDVVFRFRLVSLSNGSTLFLFCSNTRQS